MKCSVKLSRIQCLILAGVAVPKEINQDLNNAYEIGKKNFESFVQERIKTNIKGLHDPIKENNLGTCDSVSKTKKINTSQKEIMLKADKKFFSKLLLLSHKS